MLLDLLKKRCSVRNFSDKNISEEIVDYILETGRLSPSGGNEQPWKFGVINNKELIREISEIAYDQKWIENANLLIVLCTNIVADERGGRDIQKARFPELETEIENMDKELYSKLNQEEHQTKIAGTHMVLAALEHGIGSTWVSYFRVNELSKLLDLPIGYIPAEIIAFGYPKDEMKVVKKKSIDEVVFYNNELTT
ncbi:MAG TPA: nitroreductase family protein [Halanaerobiales bacterium]|nr:nitroreductase family protein [Halanaerobiales bacterium]